MKKEKTIAIVSHDAKKSDCIDWVRYNSEELHNHVLICTGTTGKLVKQCMVEEGYPDTVVERLKSGPLGGDQQIGARIAEGKIDLLIFFCDPLSIQSHYQDIGALERISVLYNISFAVNRCSADMILSSPLFSDESYEREEPDFNKYINRKLEL